MNKEQTVEIGGNKYRLAALSASDLLGVHEEFKKAAPCPVRELLDTAAAFEEPFRSEFIRAHAEEAYSTKKSRNGIESVEFQAWVNGGVGATKVFAKMFRKNHPNLTEDECFNLAIEGVAEHGEDVFAELFPQRNSRPAE